MRPASIENVVIVACIAFEVLVCALAIFRGLYRQLAFFTSYLVLLAITEVARWAVLSEWGLRSRTYFVLYWVTQVLLLLARGAVIAEISWRVLGAYPGIWRFSRRILIGLAILLVATAIFATAQDGLTARQTVVTAERGLELTIVGVLLFAIAFSRYYRVLPGRATTLVALGLGIYSAAQVANDTLFSQYLTGFFPLWADLRQGVFLFAVFLWFLAVWKPLPAAQPVPVLLEQSQYDELSPLVNTRLRQLNARLQGTLK